MVHVNAYVISLWPLKDCTSWSRDIMWLPTYALLYEYPRINTYIYEITIFYTYLLGCVWFKKAISHTPKCKNDVCKIYVPLGTLCHTRSTYRLIPCAEIAYAFTNILITLLTTCIHQLFCHKNYNIHYSSWLLLSRSWWPILYILQYP